MRLFILLITFLYIYALTLPKEFSADFNQTIVSKDKNLTYYGKLFYYNKNIVWKYLYPENKIIWIKDKVYIYEPDLEQLTISKRKNISLDNIIKKAKKLKNNLYFSQIDNKKIFFVYNKTLKKLYYKNQIGDTITIYFYNQKNDVNKSVFQIKIPKNIDIVYQN